MYSHSDEPINDKDIGENVTDMSKILFVPNKWTEILPKMGQINKIN